MADLRFITSKTAAPPMGFSDRCKAATAAALRSGYLFRLYPDGKRAGLELRAADISGGKGDSFSINMSTGAWADFATTDHKGGDLVSLIAAREGIDSGKALEILEQETGLASLPEKPGKSRPAAQTKGNPTKVWVYTDERGRRLYEAHRWEKEGFKKTCRIYGMKSDAPKVPLYLPELLRAVSAGRPVFVVEGEPKADALRAWGLDATSFIGGAKGYKTEAAKWFAGADVVILPDADEAGLSFGELLAGDLVGAGSRSIKTIELPGARFQGYDVVDWIRDGGTLHDLSELVNAAPAVNPQEDEKRPRPLQIKASDYRAGDSRKRGYQQYEWLLENSFRRGQLGLLCGPPGCGKGTLALQMGLSLAAGHSVLDHWQVDGPSKVLYISAEDDQALMDNRLNAVYKTLPEEFWLAADDNMSAVPVCGRVHVCQVDREGLKETENFTDLKNVIADFKPDLLILDTLIKFFGAEENDNVIMTQACGLMEEIIAEYGCNIIMIHHTGKTSGDLAAKPDDLHKALNQTALRGASALAGSARWVFLMAPMASGLAEKVIGSGAKSRNSGTYIAARVAKKNAGPAEEIIYLEKGVHGIMTRVDPAGDEGKEDAGNAEDDARELAMEVVRREESGLPRLSVTSGKTDLGWKHGRWTDAVKTAVSMGLLEEAKNIGRAGRSLIVKRETDDPFL